MSDDGYNVNVKEDDVHQPTATSEENGSGGNNSSNNHPTSTASSTQYQEGQEVLYTNNQGSTFVTIKKVHYDDELQPYYTIDMKDGREKQTDTAHLSLVYNIGGDDNSSNISHKPSEAVTQPIGNLSNSATAADASNSSNTAADENIVFESNYYERPPSPKQSSSSTSSTQSTKQQPQSQSPNRRASQEYYDILEMAQSRLQNSPQPQPQLPNLKERDETSDGTEEGVIEIIEEEEDHDYDDDDGNISHDSDDAVRKKKKKRKKSKSKNKSGRKSNKSNRYYEEDAAAISSSDGGDGDESSVEVKRRSVVFTSLFPTNKLMHHSVKKPFETSINANDLAKVGYKDDDTMMGIAHNNEFDPNDELPNLGSPGRSDEGTYSMWNPASLVTAAQSKLSGSKVDSHGQYHNNNRRRSSNNNDATSLYDRVRNVITGSNANQKQRNGEMPTDFNLHNIGKSDSNISDNNRRNNSSSSSNNNSKQRKKKKKYASLTRHDSIDWGDESIMAESVRSELADYRKPYRDNADYEEEEGRGGGDVEMVDDCSFRHLNDANVNYRMNEKLVQRLIRQKQRRNMACVAMVVIVFFAICTAIYFYDDKRGRPKRVYSPQDDANDNDDMYDIHRNKPPPRPHPPPPVEPAKFDDAPVQNITLTDLQNIANTIMSTADPSVMQNSHSPQSKALEWSKNDLNIYNVDSKSRVAQRFILATLYYATNGTAWKTNTNWGDGHECEWHGVGCEHDERGITAVTYLDLNSNNLVGFIPREIGYITTLEQIHLWGNKLVNTIPETMSQLVNLNTLYLDKNYLSGEMEDTFNQLKNLKHLDLSENRLRGHIPHGLGSLTNLSDLRLSNNLLTGTFPVSLISLTNLQTLLLDSNSLGGSLPTLMGEMSSLVTIRMQENDLKGTLPSFVNAKVLEEAHFDGNYFSGTIPDFGSQRLRELYLGQNAITGGIPDSFGNLVKLEIFSASSNMLSSTIPAAIGTVNDLHILDLSYNKLSGELPYEISGMPMLRELRLDHNRLRGFPGFIGMLGQLKHLEIVHLNNNLFGGKLDLPPSLADLVDLKELAFQNNDFAGAVPEFICDLLLDVLTSDCWGSTPRVECSCCSECF